MAKAKQATTATADKSTDKARKKVRKVVTEGIAHIHASFNNTIITITDKLGNALAWSSSASCGFRGSRKSTPFAAQVAAEKVAIAVIENFGMRTVEVHVKGPGPGRESAIRALAAASGTVQRKSSTVVQTAVVSEEGDEGGGDEGGGDTRPVRTGNVSLRVQMIIDVTGIPHNGCKDPKKRRV